MSKKSAYDHNQVESKWLEVWEKHKLFYRPEASKPKDKLYLLFAFAYPSGSGLHVGHVESKTALDILARYNRMRGKDVFFPVGWDAFGLPAENYAVKTGIHPKQTTQEAINTFQRQIKRIGISYNWDHELATNQPDYYRWTQWIFLQLYQNDLAYKASGKVNWCPSCQTVLANEQVVDGECERCGHLVVQKELTQWYFKITQYADELISGLDQVDWPKPTADQQLHWIGKSTGDIVKFKVKDTSLSLECFTTRLDTIFGVTFIAISPEKFTELELGEHLDQANQAKIEAYLQQSQTKTEEERKIGEKDKTGVDTGIKAINPVSGELVPIYLADYVLASYGTGTVMGVPAHDLRDYQFAQKHNLPMRQVISSDGSQIEELTTDKLYHGLDGVLINSGEYSQEKIKAAKKKLRQDFKSAIKPQTQYKLRDWLISRQRYWGTPIPIVYDPEGKPHPVKEEHLPWLLPEDVEFKPSGESPLKDSKELHQRVEDLYGKGWTPEYDTMDTFVDSSWYYLRYPHITSSEHSENSESQNIRSSGKSDLQAIRQSESSLSVQAGEFSEQLPFNPDLLKQWLPVDFYMIGPEHIVLHLLYSRFFTKFFRDQGWLDFDEPFQRMRHQGMILGPDNKKMSKSKGNVIDPDAVIREYGADTLRLYEMFMGPIEADKPWSETSVVGVYRFLQRVSKLIDAETADLSQTSDQSVHQKLHQTLNKVSADIQDLKFNTAIAAMMELLNQWEASRKTRSDSKSVLNKADIETFTLMLAPFAPFIAEEIYSKLSESGGNFDSVHLQVWPTVDKQALESETRLVVAQVNGKVRGQVEVDKSELSSEAEITKMARSINSLKPWLESSEPIKTIVVDNQDDRPIIVNFVIKN